jgi:hypothetical protein
MERVLKKPESRAAAIDTLCHIAQQAGPKLTDGSVKPETLQQLRADIDALTDPRWANETAFLRSKLQPAPSAGGTPAPVPVPVPVPTPQQQVEGAQGAPSMFQRAGTL